MNRGCLPLLVFLLLAIATALNCSAEPQKTAAKKDKAKTEEKAEDAEKEPDHMEDRWVVMLGVYKDFAEAKADAEKFAAVSKVPFSMDGRIYDKKGLRYPDDYEDEAWKGEYLPRRYNTATIDQRDVTEYLSVEKSDAYEGFKPGFYIIVGSIAESAAQAKKETARFLSASKDTYFKKTTIYMGCLH